MRGMQRLVDLRRGGQKPGLVVLYVPGQGASRVCEGALQVERHEHPATADLRALKGLTVIVMGRPRTGFNEAEGWARAAMRAEANAVGLAFPGENGGTDGPAWIRLHGEDLA